MVQTNNIWFFALSLISLALALAVFKDSMLFLVSMNVALVVIVMLISIHLVNSGKIKVKKVFLPKVVEVEVPIVKEIIVEKQKKVKYVGHVKSKKYHIPGCYWAEKISYTNLINFFSLYEAQKKKYKKCQTCFALPKTI